MSTVPHEALPTTSEPLRNLQLFDYSGADIILRSQDSYHFRVPKTYIVNSSPVLGDLIQNALDSPQSVNAGSSDSSDSSLPILQLQESSELLRCLVTFIFPVPPLLPSALEEIMELLSVAQKYQMRTALVHIRGTIALRNSLPTGLEPALRIYTLALKYGLRPEALQAAQATLNYPMTIEVFDDKLDIMPGASYYELWKYRETVRAILESDLTEFRMSCARGTITGLRCTELSPCQIPTWLDEYIESIAESPNLFDSVEFNIAMAHHLSHLKEKANALRCECASIPSRTIRNFWEALASVVRGSFEKAESPPSLVHEREDPEAPIDPAPSPLETFDLRDANLIIRSSDLVDFRVHKSVLAVVSPFFKDLLSLSQPSDSESVDGLPVVRLAEDSELLNTLVSMLYPIDTVIPKSYDKVLHLLAACQKYEMPSVQSSIRDKVNWEFPAPEGDEAFFAYVFACGKGLIPEVEDAARQTLDHPMTFETLGEGLQLFDGSALRELADFRKRCRDSLIACLDSFLEVQPPGPSSIWIGCPEVMPKRPEILRRRVLPTWLTQLLTRNQNALKIQEFTRPLDIHSRIRGEHSAALQDHVNCSFCLGVHLGKGSTFCAELENKLVQARDKVTVRCDRGV